MFQVTGVANFENYQQSSTCN